MSSDKQHGCLIFECDGCGETFTGDRGDSFEAVWRAAREDGWRARKLGRDWIHACGRCELPR